MHIGLIFAMEEEAAFITNLFKNNGTLVKHSAFQLHEYTKNNIKFSSIISKIGKGFSAAATTVLLEKQEVDAIINIGSCGGLNCQIGDIILSNEALYHDVDVTAFGYPKGALPKQPLVFVGNQKAFNLTRIVNDLSNKNLNLTTGKVATGDQFINNIETVKQISGLSNNIKALEMEAAAIAQVCNAYDKDFLLIKKVSDLADHTADSSFKDQITNFENKIIEIIDHLIEIL
ncbi:5'-methylthioadenosine/adenosylhomocysteine nucleosidase [Rickettsiales bacterium LUAb2]